VKERAARDFGVTSTPTFFVNGQLHRGDMSLEAFDEALGG
jgi:protein-disulfide isomerase